MSRYKQEIEILLSYPSVLTASEILASPSFALQAPFAENETKIIYKKKISEREDMRKFEMSCYSDAMKIVIHAQLRTNYPLRMITQ